MNELLKKILKIEKIMSYQFGTLFLFAMIENEENLNTWDVIISTDLNKINENELINKLIEVFLENLSKSEILLISSFLYLKPDTAFVKAINEFNIKKSYTSINEFENGIVEINNRTVNDIFISRAYIFKSEPSKSQRKQKRQLETI